MIGVGLMASRQLKASRQVEGNVYVGQDHDGKVLEGDIYVGQLHDRKVLEFVLRHRSSRPVFLNRELSHRTGIGAFVTRSVTRFFAAFVIAGALWFSAAVPANAQTESKTEEKVESAEPAMGWKWANFAILVLGLGYLVSKNLPPLFRSRTEDIQKGIAEAQKIKQDADRRASAVEQRVKALGSEIEAFRTSAKAEMQLEGERIRKETAHQISRLEQQAGQEIEASGKAARRALKNYAATLALELAEQRLRGRVGSSDGLVDHFIQDLGHQNVNRGETRN